MLHNPLDGITPSQRLAATRHQERAERFRSAAHRQSPVREFDPPKMEEAVLPPIPNSVMAYAADFVFRPSFTEVETIQRAVLAFYPKVTLNDVKSARRTAIVVLPRQIAMYLVKELTTRSLPDIGRRFGGRDHTTVLHAVRKIDRLQESDEALRAHLEEIKALVSGASNG